MVTLDTKLKRNQDWLTSEVDGEIVMMSIENGSYYALTPTGVSVWNKIEEPTKVSELCDLLAEEYEVDSVECQKDTLAFLNELSDEKIIEIIE